MESSVKDKTLPCLDKNQVSVNISDRLNSCIQIEKSKISRRNNVPQQIRFCLNPEVLTQIERARAEKIKLILSKAKLADLRYYILLNFTSEYTKVNHVKHASGLTAVRRSHLTFSSNYSSFLNQRGETLFRSYIDLKGVISQQIQQDLWENQQLLERISQAHYWLIAEILAQLPLKRKLQKFRVTAAFSLFAASLITITLWYFAYFNIWLGLLLFASLFLSINFISNKFIIKIIRRLIVRNLANRRLGKSITSRQLSKKILLLILD